MATGWVQALPVATAALTAWGTTALVVPRLPEPPAEPAAGDVPMAHDEHAPAKAAATADCSVASKGATSSKDPSTTGTTTPVSSPMATNGPTTTSSPRPAPSPTPSTKAPSSSIDAAGDGLGAHVDPAAAISTWTKPAYATLATGRAQLVSLLLGAAAGGVVATQPGWAWPALLVLAGPTAALVVVDAQTTYLPRVLNHACANALAAMLCLGAALTHLSSLLPIALAAAAAGGLFWLLWRLGLGIGFGDVRLVPLLAAGGATAGLSHAARTLLLGSIVGVIWGLAATLWRRRHPSPLGTAFAYGPSLWIGLWLALLLP